MDRFDYFAEHGLTRTKIEMFYEMCKWMSDSNGGCHRQLVWHKDGYTTVGVVIDRIPQELRKGIVFYSGGHGWRVRKDPHWQVVFRERFPEFTKHYLHPTNYKGRREHLTNEWRKHGYGRLYWKANNPRWRWDRGVVCMVLNGTVREEFFGMDALENYIDEIKRLKKDTE